MLEYSRLAFHDTSKMFDKEGELIPIHEMDEDTRRAISGFESESTLKGKKGNVSRSVLKKIKTYDKTKSLDSLSRIQGLFEKDNQQNQTVINLVHDEVVKKKRAVKGK